MFGSVAGVHTVHDEHEVISFPTSASEKEHQSLDTGVIRMVQEWYNFTHRKLM